MKSDDHLLCRAPFRPAIEDAVSANLGRPWTISRVEDRGDEASHSAAILSDALYPVFAKLGRGALAGDRFAREAHGLRYLSRLAGVATPTVLDTLLLDDGAILVMEAFTPVAVPTAADWRGLGAALARVHQVRGECCGLEVYNYWGDLYQDNTPTADWFDFYAERRLLPRLRAAVDSGNLPASFIAPVERLARRLPRLGGPEVQPRLLHGDAHRNNLVATTRGPVFIDPAVHYGHPELDLAYVDFFAPVPRPFFDGYRDAGVIAAGFPDRRDLWRIHAWLGMVEVAGAAHIDDLSAALAPYM